MEFRIFQICRGTIYHLPEQILCHDALEGITTSSTKSIPQLGFLQSLSKALLDEQFFVEEILTVKWSGWILHTIFPDEVK